MGEGGGWYVYYYGPGNNVFDELMFSRKIWYCREYKNHTKKEMKYWVMKFYIYKEEDKYKDIRK